MKHLTNKVAVISGAGSGIGKALAFHLAREGCRLALNDVNPDRLKATASLLEEYGVEMMLSDFNVADRKAWEDFAMETLGKFGEVDLVINNAGVALGRYTVEETSYDDLEWIMNINFYGMVYGTKSFLPHLLKRKESAVVNVSSILGIAGLAWQSGYCASKFAIRGFTESLRMEAMKDFPQLTVHTVHPGGIKTNIAADANWDNSSLNAEEQKLDTERFETSFITTATDAAAKIIADIKKKRHRILIGPDAKRIDRAVRLMPTGYSKVILKEFEKLGL